MSTVNTVTEQLTRAGQAIEHDSFAIIDAEVQGHSYTPEQIISTSATTGVPPRSMAHFGMVTHQFISDADVIAQAQAENTTRAVQAMRKAHRLGLLEGAIVGIGNAPTALIELARLIAEEGVRPALVVGMPVGFVSAAESKDLIASQHTVPWMVIRGRKGGSTLVVAALHALLALAEARQKQTMAQG